MGIDIRIVLEALTDDQWVAVQWPHHLTPLASYQPGGAVSPGLAVDLKRNGWLHGALLYGDLAEYLPVGLSPESMSQWGAQEPIVVQLGDVLALCGGVEASDLRDHFADQRVRVVAHIDS